MCTHRCTAYFVVAILAASWASSCAASGAASYPSSTFCAIMRFYIRRAIGNMLVRTLPRRELTKCCSKTERTVVSLASLRRSLRDFRTSNACVSPLFMQTETHNLAEIHVNGLRNTQEQNPEISAYSPYRGRRYSRERALTSVLYE